MNHLSFSLLSTLLALTFAGCGAERIESTWASNPIVVDGDHGEWPASQLTYVEKVRGVFGAANDDSSLSVMFRFRDQRIARKVMMGGATVWWGRDGKGSKDFGVRYAAKHDIHQMLNDLPDPREMGRSRGPMTREPEEGPLHDQIFFIEKDIEAPIGHGAGQQLEAASTYHKGFYCYEVAIPLGRTELLNQALDIRPGAEIRLCVELGGINPGDREIFEAAMKERMSGRDGMGDRGGMGDRSGMGDKGGRGGRGGMGGQGRMGGRGDMEEMFEREEMWFDIRLAEGPAESDSTS